MYENCSAHRLNRWTRQTIFNSSNDGFTLIEVLIALIVVSIALLGVIKSSHETITAGTYLEQKTYASWVADKAIAELQMGVVVAPVERQLETIFNQNFYWSATVQNTPDQHVSKLEVSVYNASGQRLIVVDGYLS